MQSQQLNQNLKQVLKRLQPRLKTLNSSLLQALSISALLAEGDNHNLITHNGNSVTFTTYEYNSYLVNIPGWARCFEEEKGIVPGAKLAAVTQEALEKIDACINLDDQALGIFPDLLTFFNTSLTNLKEYAQVASKLSSDNIRSIIGNNQPGDFQSVLEAISPIKEALERLEKSKLVSIFNDAASGKTNDDAKQHFIDMLKGDRVGLGRILSTDAKTDSSRGQTNKFQIAFDAAAGKLFNSCAKLAKKVVDEQGEYFNRNNPLEADLKSTDQIWEAIKTFILAIFTLGCVKTDRTKMNNEIKTFCELLKKHDASNQLVTNDAKNVSFAVNS